MRPRGSRKEETTTGHEAQASIGYTPLAKRARGFAAPNSNAIPLFARAESGCTSNHREMGEGSFYTRRTEHVLFCHLAKERALRHGFIGPPSIGGANRATKTARQ
jgi:hypothetical protein